MSASMYWRPTPPNPEGEYVDDHLRQILTKCIWGDWGPAPLKEPGQLGKDQLAYLTGLRDANIEGAQELIDAINKHGSIEVWIER